MKQTILSLFLLFPIFLHAQQGIVTAGGQTAGDEGSVSYSIGQMLI